MQMDPRTRDAFQEIGFYALALAVATVVVVDVYTFLSWPSPQWSQGLSDLRHSSRLLAGMVGAVVFLGYLQTLTRAMLDNRMPPLSKSALWFTLLLLGQISIGYLPGLLG